MTLPVRLVRSASGDVFAAALVLALLLNVTFFPYLWLGKTLLSSAADAPSIYDRGAEPSPMVGDRAPKLIDYGAPAWQTEPDFAQIHRQIFDEKHLPLWNPSIGYGQPLAADLQAQPFFPLSIIAFWHPSPAAYNWWCVARLFVAGLGAFCFLRLFTSFWPALAAGISMMFAGYYLLYYDIPHLSVETLIPWLFYVNERIVRAPRFSNICWAAGANVLVYLGGMPESALLALGFAYLYAVYRVVTYRALRPRALRVGAGLVIEAVAGVGASAFLLLPFMEYVRVALDQHRPENIGGVITGALPDYGSLYQLLTYIVPLIFGPPWGNVTTNLSGFSGARGFFGIAGLFLALVAIFGAAGDRSRRQYAWTGLVPFFAVAACFFVLKRFGSPLVNWVGYLPGFSLVLFVKYEEPLLAFAVAAMVGFGCARIADARPSGIIRWWSAVVALGCLTATYAVVRVLVTPAMVGRGYTIYSLIFAIGILGLAVLAAAALGTARSRLRRAGASVAIVAVVAIEAIGDFLVPMHYMVEQPPSSARNPYRGAPFVTYLESATRHGYERVLGQDDLLYPNWAGAFALYDVRDLDAMYEQHYLPFVRAFLAANPEDPLFKDRFTQAPQLETPPQRRFLALSSVRYIITTQGLDLSDSFFGPAHSQNVASLPAEKKPSLALKRYAIAGVEREGLLEHPPFERLPMHIVIPRDAKGLNFGIGMDPAVYAPGVNICGAGAEFRLEIRDAGGRITPLFRRYIDPKHIVGERHWIDQTVPVAPWAGQPVDILLSTAPGPQGNTCADWAVWGGGRFVPQQPATRAHSDFELVFRDGKVLVYRFDGAFPRIGIYDNVKTTATAEAALAALTAPGFNVSSTVVITPDGPQASREVAAVDGAPAAVRAGTLLAYDAQDVKARVVLSRTGVVVLNDTYYPGWRAYVDGKQTTLLRADALFRGVVVGPGEHLVEFTYEPQSFVAGVAITSATIASGIAAAFFLRMRRRRVPLQKAA